jgi:hypothetical protein
LGGLVSEAAPLAGAEDVVDDGADKDGSVNFDEESAKGFATTKARDAAAAPKKVYIIAFISRGKKIKIIERM